MIVAGIDQTTGRPRPIRANDDGSLAVADEGGAATGDMPPWAARLCWEIQELRRLYAVATDQLFEEYPADGFTE